MRIWDIARKPRLLIHDLQIPLTVIRSMAGKYDEVIVPVVKSIVDESLVGFLTPVELIMPTSHHTSIRVRDAIREHPILYSENDIGEVFHILREHKIIGAPVVYSREDNRLLGVTCFKDILSYLINAGYKPFAETVSEIMTTKNLENYMVPWNERVNKVWSRIVFHGQPGVVVVRDLSEPIPVGLVTYKEFLRSGRWLFHRESEQHITTPAKVQRIMLRGVLVATHDMPIEMVAKVMAEHDIPLVPVINKDGMLVGVVTYEDIVRAFIEGAKPGRVPVPLARVMPIPVAREERVLYVSKEKILEGVVVAKPLVKPAYSGIRVEDILVEELPAITINDTVEHARKEMLRRKTDYLLVVDEKGEIIGVVTKWNMLHALGFKGPLWKRRPKDKYFIEYIMTRNIPRIRVGTPIEDAALQLVSSETEVAIVIDDKGETIGFITKDNIVEASRKILTDVYAENIIYPGKVASVNPFHSLYHVVTKMKTLFLDAITVYDGSKVVGVVSSNRLVFVAYEDAATGIRSRRLIWVRKLVKGAARKGRYVKITPLLAIDAMVPYKNYLKPDSPVIRAIELMLKEDLNGIPILSDDRKIISIVSKNDVLRELSRRAVKVAEVAKKMKIEKEVEKAGRSKALREG